jgi:hypothetical protein
MKPLWLLDIDGVINACNRHRPIGTWPGYDNWIKKNVVNSQGSWPILAAKPVLDFITYVHDSGLAEIRWHTTWQEEALDFGDQFGLPTFNIQPCPEAVKNGTMYWWKFPAVQRELSVGRRVLWTDDDITIRLTPTSRRLLEVSTQLKMIVPKTHTGLSPDNLVDITYFLEDVS